MRTLLTAAAAALALTGTAAAAPAVSFIIDGDTFNEPFTLSNESTDGERIVRFFIDLDGTGLVFDTVTGGVPNTTAGVPFGAANGTGPLVGLVSGDVVDGGSTLDILFDDFDAGETFSFDIDVDRADGSPTVIGNDLIGASAFIDLANGQRLLGTFLAIAGRPQASGFAITAIIDNPVPVPAAAPLFASAMAGLTWARRRKKAKA